MTTASYVTDQIQTTNGLNAVNLSAGVNAYVAQGVHISASGSGGVAGIAGPGGSVLTVEGDVFGDGLGVYFYQTGQNSILISKSGSVAGNNWGIYDAGNNSIISNAGTISGNNGIMATGISADVHNFGMIHGASNGVAFLAVSGVNLLTNAGVIEAFAAVVGSAASEVVQNVGLITGTVILNDGADFFDTRGGTMQGTVYLGNGNDSAFGGEGADSIDGGADLDRLRGKQGDDRLDGGLGKDILTGGSDEDEFYFSTTLGSTNVDNITDFIHKEDTILLYNGIFLALGADVGKSEFLVRFSGHAATKASHHLIYDNLKGTLWYDADGNGNGAAIKFAQLGTSSDHPTNLNYHDFAII